MKEKILFSFTYVIFIYFHYSGLQYPYQGVDDINMEGTIDFDALIQFGDIMTAQQQNQPTNFN